MKLLLTTAALAVGLLGGILISSPGSASPTDAELPTKAEMIEKIKILEVDPVAVEKGRQLYGNTCLFCHGPEGIGARAPNLVEGMFKPGWDREVPYAYDVIRNGRPGTIMGAYKDKIADEEIWNVMAYLRSRGTIVLEERKNKRKKR